MGAAASTILQKAPSKLDAEKLKELVGEERYDHKTFEIVCGEDGFVSKAVLTAHVMRVAAEEAAQKKAEGESGEDDDGLGYFIEFLEGKLGFRLVDERGFKSSFFILNRWLRVEFR